MMCSLLTGVVLLCSGLAVAQGTLGKRAKAYHTASRQKAIRIGVRCMRSVHGGHTVHIAAQAAPKHLKGEHDVSKLAVNP